MTAQELKNSVLQLAIQGKLVKQDPNDEPADKLLEKIKVEREKLIKEKKIKKEKYSEIYKDETDNHYYEKFEDGTINDITEEIPFDVSSSWCWTRVYNFSDIYTGNSIPENLKNLKYTGLKKGYNYIGTKDVKFDNTIDYNNGIKIPFEEIKFKKAYKNNTLICIEGGSAGKKVALLSEDVCFGNKLATINSWVIHYKYIYLVFQSNIVQKFFKDNITGIIGGVSINKLKTLLIPLPPLNEQQRIVEKIEQLMLVVKEYDKNYEKLEKLNASYKEELKKSILQYAIQGKLVKQNPNDESAEILINKILDEKRELIKTKQIKKENLSVIYKDSTDNQFYEKFDDGTIKNVTEEIPFEIPDSWCWTRLRNIIYNHGQKTPKSKFTYIDIGTLDNINHKLNSVDNIIESGKAPSRARKIVKLGDIIYATVRPYLHNTCIIDRNFSCEPIASTGFAVLSCLQGIYNKYIFNVLLSNFFDNYVNSHSQGVSYPAINDTYLYNALIPCPPIAEQQRIVEKVEKIFQKL